MTSQVVAPAPLAADNLIGADERPAAGGRTFESRNPARQTEVVGVFALSGAVDVDEAVRVAAVTQQEWTRVPWPARGQIIMRTAQLLAERKEELAHLMTREMGKVLTEARGDVQEAIDMGHFIAGEGRRAFGETVPSELRDKWAMTTRQPLGVVGIITPWNFPIAIPSWKIFPAIMAGNAVVFKPAEDTPACALAFVTALRDAGLPDGVVNLVFGDHEAGEAVVRHPGIAGISFTGSTQTGRVIGRICGEQLKRCSMELGGKNAIAVMGDADIALAVEGALWGAFGTSGQRCTASSRLIVDRSALAAFTDALLAQTTRLRIGDGLDESVHIGPMINGPQRERAHGYTKIGVDEGATLLTGGEFARGDGLDDGFFYQPTIFTDVSPDMRIAQEEIFGPTTAVIPVDGLDAAIAAANGTPYGLSLSLYTNDLRTAFRAIAELQAGIVYVNAPTIGAEIQLPFGGVKNTGNGHREAGRVAMDQFSEWKSVYVDYSGRLQRAQIDTE